MELQDIRDIVHEEMRRHREDYQSHEFCPDCDDHMPMTKIDRYSAKEVEEGKVETGPDTRHFLRCQGCLSLFEQKMERIEHLPKKGSW